MKTIMTGNTENPQIQEGAEALLLSSFVEAKRDVLDLIVYLRMLINKK